MARGGNGAGTGKLAGRHTDDFARTPNGAGVKRHASEDETACLIRQDDGDGMPKSVGEIEKV